MALADRIKTVRTAIRLKHSLAADRELNETIDRMKAEFFAKVQNQEIPDALNIQKLISGE